MNYQSQLRLFMKAFINFLKLFNLLFNKQQEKQFLTIKKLIHKIKRNKIKLYKFIQTYYQNDRNILYKQDFIIMTQNSSPNINSLQKEHQDSLNQPLQQKQIIQQKSLFDKKQEHTNHEQLAYQTHVIKSKQDSALKKQIKYQSSDEEQQLQNRNQYIFDHHANSQAHLYMKYVALKTQRFIRRISKTQSDLYFDFFKGTVKNGLYQAWEYYQFIKTYANSLSNNDIQMIHEQRNSIKLVYSSKSSKLMTFQVKIFHFAIKVYIVNLDKNTNFDYFVDEYGILIGSGSGGDVYKLPGIEGALKRISLVNNTNNIDFVQNFIKEYALNKLLSCLKIGPKLLKPYHFDIICTGNYLCFFVQQCYKTIEYLQQGCISRKISPNQIFQKIENDLISGLFFLHKVRIVHYDIKPQNIMYSSNFQKFVFIDFGLSQFKTFAQGYMEPQNFKGTFNYCSEQMQKLFLNMNKKEFIDAYYNDCFCLKKSLKAIYASIKFMNIQRLEHEQIQQKFYQMEHKFQQFKQSDDGLKNLRLQRDQSQSFGFFQSFQRKSSHNIKQSSLNNMNISNTAQNDIFQDGFDKSLHLNMYLELLYLISQYKNTQIDKFLSQNSSWALNHGNQIIKIFYQLEINYFDKQFFSHISKYLENSYVIHKKAFIPIPKAVFKRYKSFNEQIFSDYCYQSESQYVDQESHIDTQNVYQKNTQLDKFEFSSNQYYKQRKRFRFDIKNVYRRLFSKQELYFSENSYNDIKQTLFCPQKQQNVIKQNQKYDKYFLYLYFINFIINFLNRNKFIYPLHQKDIYEIETPLKELLARISKQSPQVEQVFQLIYNNKKELKKENYKNKNQQITNQQVKKHQLDQQNFDIISKSVLLIIYKETIQEKQVQNYFHLKGAGVIFIQIIHPLNQLFQYFRMNQLKIQAQVIIQQRMVPFLLYRINTINDQIVCLTNTFIGEKSHKQNKFSTDHYIFEEVLQIRNLFNFLVDHFLAKLNTSYNSSRFIQMVRSGPLFYTIIEILEIAYDRVKQTIQTTKIQLLKNKDQQKINILKRIEDHKIVILTQNNQVKDQLKVYEHIYSLYATYIQEFPLNPSKFLEQILNVEKTCENIIKKYKKQNILSGLSIFNHFNQFFQFKCKCMLQIGKNYSTILLIEEFLQKNKKDWNSKTKLFQNQEKFIMHYRCLLLISNKLGLKQKKKKSIKTLLNIFKNLQKKYKQNNRKIYYKIQPDLEQKKKIVFQSQYQLFNDTSSRQNQEITFDNDKKPKYKYQDQIDRLLLVLEDIKHKQLSFINMQDYDIEIQIFNGIDQVLLNQLNIIKVLQNLAINNQEADYALRLINNLNSYLMPRIDYLILHIKSTRVDYKQIQRKELNLETYILEKSVDKIKKSQQMTCRIYFTTAKIIIKLIKTINNHLHRSIINKKYLVTQRQSKTVQIIQNHINQNCKKVNQLFQAIYYKQQKKKYPIQYWKNVQYLITQSNTKKDKNMNIIQFNNIFQLQYNFSLFQLIQYKGFATLSLEHIKFSIKTCIQTIKFSKQFYLNNQSNQKYDTSINKSTNIKNIYQIFQSLKQYFFNNNMGQLFFIQEKVIEMGKILLFKYFQNQNFTSLFHFINQLSHALQTIIETKTLIYKFWDQYLIFVVNEITKKQYQNNKVKINYSQNKNAEFLEEILKKISYFSVYKVNQCFLQIKTKQKIKISPFTSLYAIGYTSMIISLIYKQVVYKQKENHKNRNNKRVNQIFNSHQDYSLKFPLESPQESPQEDSLEYQIESLKQLSISSQIEEQRQNKLHTYVQNLKIFLKKIVLGDLVIISSQYVNHILIRELNFYQVLNQLYRLSYWTRGITIKSFIDKRNKIIFQQQHVYNNRKLKYIQNLILRKTAISQDLHFQRTELNFNHHCIYVQKIKQKIQRLKSVYLNQNYQIK